MLFLFAAVARRTATAPCPESTVATIFTASITAATGSGSTAAATTGTGSTATARANATVVAIRAGSTGALSSY